MKSRWLLGMLLVLAACAKPNGTASEPPQTATVPAAAAGPRVVFPDGKAVTVELVADDASRQQGLMFRDQLRPDHGMLFLFPQDGDYPFWMKNTFIPLDMIWIDSGNRIAHIAHDVQPCRADPCPSYPPNATARYVLEVAAGVARQHGLKDGDVVRFEEVEGIIPR